MAWLVRGAHLRLTVSFVLLVEPSKRNCIISPIFKTRPDQDPVYPHLYVCLRIESEL